MIKAIIFDFDGVLVESAQIKTEAFRRLFSKCPEKVDEIVSYHIKNMGISRYVKFKYFYENILKEPYSEEIGLDLGNRFSDIVLEEVKKAPLVRGAKRFLVQAYKKYFLFIASGTPQRELDDIISFKGLDKYFDGVYGASAAKPEIIKRILKKYRFKKKHVVFVGDAESDRKVADDTGIHFILRATNENSDVKVFAPCEIRDLTKLEGKITALGK